MKGKSQVCVLIVALLLTAKYTYPQYFVLGEGQVKIELGSATNILPSFKFYAGDKIRLRVSSGQVRHNWSVHVTEDCFFWFIDCDEIRTPINNERSPKELPVNTFLIKSNNQPLDANGYILYDQERSVAVSSTLPYNEPLSLKGFFGDYPSAIFKDGIYIDRSHSDGMYTIQVAVNATARIDRLKQVMQQKGNNLSFADVNHEHFLNTSLRQFYKPEIAAMFARQVQQFPGMDQEEKKSILQLALELDAANPAINLAMANNYLSDNDLVGAELAARDALKKLQNTTNDPLLLAHAYLALGQVNHLKGVGLRSDKAHEAASCYGLAADLFMKANEYPNAVKAFMLQAEAFKGLNTLETLEAANKVLEKAYSLQTETLLIAKNGKYGLIDYFGQEVLLPTFDSIKHVEGMLLPFRKNGKWGYINKLGEELISPSFDDAWGFKSGIARVVKDGVMMYIDSRGNTLFGQNFKWASDFHEKLAVVETSDRKFYYMNHQGNKFALIPPCLVHNTGTPAAPCTDQTVDLDKVEAAIKKNHFFGASLVNIFLTRFRNAWINRQIAPYNKQNEPYWVEAGDYGFLDSEMNIRFEANGSYSGVKLNGKNFITTGPPPNNNMVYLDSTLEVISLPPHLGKWWINQLANGHFNYVPDGSTRFGLIDRNGNKILEPAFDHVGWIWNSDHVFTKNGNTYHLRKADGSIFFQFETTAAFINPMRMFPLHPEFEGEPGEYYMIELKHANNVNRQGIINGKGEWVVDTVYTKIQLINHKTGTFLVSKDGLTGVYQAGKGLIVAIEWDMLYYSWPNNTFTAIKNELIGLLDEKGKEVFEPKFTGINYITDQLVSLEYNGSWKLYNVTGGEVISKPCKSILPVMRPMPKLNYTESPYPILDSNNRIPFLAGRLVLSLNESVIFQNKQNKYGVLALNDGSTLIPAEYDSIYTYGGKLFATKANSDFDICSIFDFAGNRVIEDELIDANYNPFLNFFEGFTLKGEYCVYDGNDGHLVLAAKVVTTDKLIDAIIEEKYTLQNIRVYSPGETIMLDGNFLEISALGKMYYLTSGTEVWQVDPLSGYKNKINASKIHFYRALYN